MGQALHNVLPASDHVPAAHALHAAEPDASLKVPAGQDAHGPPAGPLQPAWQTQLVSATLPLAELDPAAHALHAAEPDAFLKVPGGQATHVSPSRPVVPGLHRQSARSAEPIDEFEFTGQALHDALPASDHVPGGHGLQTSLPGDAVLSEYKPAAHSEHAKRLVPLSNEPAGHGRHASYVGDCRNPIAHQQDAIVTVPAADVEFPGHGKHALAPVELLYVFSTHSEQPLTPAAEKVPASQSAQVCEPGTFLYLPAAHAVHAAPLGPV